MTTTATRPTKLAAIAETMRKAITEQGAAYSHQRLVRGLEVALQRSIAQNGAHRWRLAIARPGVAPSPDEVDIVRRDFGVPEGSEQNAFTKERTNWKSGVTTTWHVVEVFWYEAI